MSIKINSNFEIGSPQPLDSRNVLSKSDMININENIWPSIYYTMCKDDGKMYIFNKDNEINEDTGKFRPVEISDNIDYDKAINTPLSKEIVSEIDKTVVLEVSAESSSTISIADGETVPNTIIKLNSDTTNIDNVVSGDMLVIEFNEDEKYELELSEDNGKLKGVYNKDIENSTDIETNAITLIIDKNDADNNVVTLFIGSDINSTNQQSFPKIYTEIKKNSVNINPYYKDFFNNLVGSSSSTTEKIVSNVIVGNINKGTEIVEGTNITDLLKMMLIKTIPPIINISTNKKVYSDEESINGTATVSVDQSGSTSTEIVSVVTDDGTDISETLSFDIDQSKTYTVTVTYKDSVTDSLLTTEESLEIIKVSPIYWTLVDNIQDITSATKDSAVSIIENIDDVDIEITSDNKYFVIITKSNIISILDANGFENVGSFISQSDDGYNIYISENPITCNNFMYTLIR